LLASISEVIDGDWLRLEPVRVGHVAAALGTPARYVTVTHRERPTLRVDVYAYGPDCFAFEDVIIWRDILIVGFGSHVHAISIATRSAITVSLGAYYCHLYPTENYLLIASGEELFRMEPDCSILWKTESLALDGIVVHDLGPPVVRGEAEWDPPGGWRPFAVFAANGKPAT
jgi:hypothetical protein